MKSAAANSKLRYIEWSLHIVFCSMLLVGVYVAQTYWLTSLRQERISVGREIQTLQSKLAKADEVAAQHEELVELKKAIERRAADITDRIPAHPNEGEFLKQTTSAAKACGITIKEYLRRGIDAHEDHSRLVVHLSLEGTFESICKFVEQLEQLPRISKVSKLRMVSRTKDGLYPMDLTLILFFRSELADARIARATQ